MVRGSGLRRSGDGPGASNLDARGNQEGKPGEVQGLSHLGGICRGWLRPASVGGLCLGRCQRHRTSRRRSPGSGSFRLEDASPCDRHHSAQPCLTRRFRPASSGLAPGARSPWDCVHRHQSMSDTLAQWNIASMGSSGSSDGNHRGQGTSGFARLFMSPKRRAVRSLVVATLSSEISRTTGRSRPSS